MKMKIKEQQKRTLKGNKRKRKIENRREKGNKKGGKNKKIFPN